MTLFCLFWVPVFYFFWRSITGGNTSGWAWALIAGSIVALFQFLNGPLVEPGGFGLSRWASGFVDIVALPVLIPLLVYLLLFFLKIIVGNIDFAGFALLWIMPGAAVRSLTWSAVQRDSILLVLVPILWTAIAIGIPFFIDRILTNARPLVIVLSGLAILFIPFAAATSYWAFFVQETTMGIVFLLIAAAPMLVSVIMSFLKARDGG